jgi:hypothetical protein
MESGPGCNPLLVLLGPFFFFFFFFFRSVARERLHTHIERVALSLKGPPTNQRTSHTQLIPNPNLKETEETEESEESEESESTQQTAPPAQPFKN